MEMEFRGSKVSLISRSSSPSGAPWEIWDWRRNGSQLLLLILQLKSLQVYTGEGRARPPAPKSLTRVEEISAKCGRRNKGCRSVRCVASSRSSLWRRPGRITPGGHFDILRGMLSILKALEAFQEAYGGFRLNLTRSEDVNHEIKGNQL